MSVQKTIDQFFKCSSNNKNTKCNEKSSGKTTNRSKLSGKNGIRNGAKTPIAGKKNDWRNNNAVDASWRAAVEAGSANSSKNSVTAQSCVNNLSTGESPEIERINDGNVTPKKLTFKSFVKACNTPPKNSSPGKISLKRKNNNLPGSHSPPKQILISNENSVNLLTKVKEIPVPTTANSTPASATKIDDFPDDFDPDIVELNITNHETSLEKSDPVLKNQKFAIAEVKIEESLNQKKNDSENVRSASNLIEKKIAPKNGNSVILTKSPWKVAVTIKTPDRSMTALSSDWQKTLEDQKNSSKSSRIEKTKNHQENLTSTKSSKINDENSSTENTNSAMNSKIKRESNTMECSPRRVLFSPPNTPKKVRLEERNSVENSSSNGIEGIARLTNGDNSSNRSPTKISGISGSSPQKDRSLKSLESPKKIAGSFDSPIKTEISRASSSSGPSEILTSPPVTPTKINGISRSSPQNDRSINSLESPKKIAGSFDSPIKTEIPKASSSSGPSEILTSPRKPLRSPATPTKTSRSSFSPRVKFSPQKPRRDSVDKGLVMRVVENLNQAKQGIILPNDFDLEAIYAKKSFDLEYGKLNTETAIKFEAKDVREPEIGRPNDFFTVLVNVFSEPMNCGYFDETELCTVFSMLTLSAKAQSLFASMLGRKSGWHKISDIKYSEIDKDLTPFFEELVAHGFFDGDIENDEISVLLHRLSADELKDICRKMKVNHVGTMDTLISRLITLSKKKCSLFPGAKSPSAALKELVVSFLGRCVRVPQRIRNLMNRIFILLWPDLDPKEHLIKESYFTLLQVRKAQKIFPPTPKERFPIFRNRSHLIRYAKAKDILYEIHEKVDKNGGTEEICNLGMLAYNRLKPYFESNNIEDEDQTSSLPSHVRRFDENYVWIKSLAKSIDAFKKKKNEGWDTAVMFLEALISPQNKISGNKIAWYEDLALIEMAHRKDLEKSANITIEALNRATRSEVDAAMIFERARKLLKRAKGISPETKKRINEAMQQQKQQICISTFEPVENKIPGKMVPGNSSGSKSLWIVKTKSSDDVSVTVEELVLHHYRRKGFDGGLHCEGDLPVTLFAVLFWPQIYEMSVPGVFVSSYQKCPLDLHSSSFFENRREDINNQMKVIKNWGYENLSKSMHEDLIKYRHYESLIPKKFAENPDAFKDCIECLGMHAVVRISERLADNFHQWKAGFPDLIVWNSATKKCKIVEVKGPGDTLSTKQRLWIQFLQTLGVDVEVCHVENKGRTYAE